jgi:uncharacterized protein YjbI with pentapeptide repeats
MVSQRLYERGWSQESIAWLKFRPFRQNLTKARTMADQMHVEKLKEGVASWNRWREAQPQLLPDLSGLTLSREEFEDSAIWDSKSEKVDLSGIDLSGASMHRATLLEVNLRSATLERADLLGATLDRVDMNRAVLRRASLARSSLNRVKLREANLEGAIFTSSRLEKTDLERANLRNVSWTYARLMTVHMTEAVSEYGDFVNCEIRDSDLNKTDFNHSDFSETRLENVRLRGSRLKKSKFTLARLHNILFTEADLENSILSGAQLADCSFRRSHLRAANLQSVRLRKCDLRWADFRNANVAGIVYNRWSYYQGIRVDGCYGSPRFVRFARDQEFIEEIRGSSQDLRYWFFYLPWLISSDCGRSFMLWAGWSVFIALVFAIRYWSMGPEHLNLGYLDHSYWSMLYYSVVTFTTLGFGDIVPKTEGAAIWVMLEVAIGYVMLGGLISIFSNKLARRS